MDLVEFSRVLRRHPVIFLTCALVCLAVAAAFTLSQDPEYEAAATGIVSAPALSDSVAGDDDERARSRATTYVALGATKGMARRVTESLGLDLDPGTLLKNTSIEQPPDTALVQVHVRSTSPGQARQLADAWLAVLSARVQEIENPEGNPRANAPSLKTVEPATTPDSPVYPRPPLNLAIGLAVGLILGCAGAFMRARSVQRIRSAADIKWGQGVGVLAEVSPAVLRRADKSRSMSARRKAGGRQALDPVFEDIRSKLQYLNVDEPPRSLLVTSTSDRAGSSTIAREVARALAQHGEKVVLVELDFDSPTMARANGLDPGSGLLQALTGVIPLRETLQSDESIGGPAYLVAGGTAPDTGELLGSRSLPVILESLNEDRYLVLDARPVFEEPATALMSSLVDAVLLVVPARTGDSTLSRAIDRVTTHAGKRLGIVLTSRGNRPRRAATWLRGSPSRRGRTSERVAESPEATDLPDGRVVAETRTRSAADGRTGRRP